MNETGRQDISASELAGKAAGHVVSYSTEGTDIVKITVGLINTDYTIGSDISFQYDETVMKMYNCNDNKNMLSPGPAGFVIKNIPEWALSQDGKDNDAEYGFTSSKLTDMTCGIIDPSYTVTQMAKEGSIRKVLATVTSNVTLSEDYRAMFAFLDDVMRFKCIENDTVFEMYDITFKLVSGKTFDDVKYDTFDLYPESKGSSSGTRLLQYGTGRTTFETPTYFVGFPGVPEPEPEFAYLNVMERIVEDKIIYFMRQFDVCTCARCKADTVALTMNGLMPKYIVTTPAAVDPLLSYYTNRLISDVTVEATKACMTIKENPRH